MHDVRSVSFLAIKLQDPIVQYYSKKFARSLDPAILHLMRFSTALELEHFLSLGSAPDPTPSKHTVALLYAFVQGRVGAAVLIEVPTGAMGYTTLPQLALTGTEPMLIIIPDTLVSLCPVACRLHIESNERLICFLTVRELTDFRMANETTSVQVNCLIVAKKQLQ